MDRVEIKDPHTGKSIVFPCNKWLSKDKEDGEIARDLFPVLSSNDSERGSRESSRSRQFDNRRPERDFDRDVDRYGGGSSSRNSSRNTDGKKEREFSFESTIRNRGDRDMLNRERDRDNFRENFRASRYD